jgi:hypothetical protein
MYKGGVLCFLSLILAQIGIEQELNKSVQWVDPLMFSVPWSSYAAYRDGTYATHFKKSSVVVCNAHLLYPSLERRANSPIQKEQSPRRLKASKTRS